MDQTRKKEQQPLRDLSAARVSTDRTEIEGAEARALSEEHLTLAEAERFRTCRIDAPEDFAFLRAVNAHLMTCAHCRALVQANTDLGDALDAAEQR